MENMGEKAETWAFCTRCGGKTWPKARFCHHCGTRLERPRKPGKKALVGILLVLILSLGAVPLLRPRSETNSWASPSGLPNPGPGSVSSLSTPQALTPSGLPNPGPGSPSRPPQPKVLGEIVEVLAPATVEEGQKFPLPVTIRNTGDLPTTFWVEVDYACGSQSQQVLLGEGESAVLTFELVAERGQDEAGISLGAGGLLLDRERAAFTVLYVDGEIAGIELPQTVEEGEPVAAVVRVRNTGNARGDFEVRLGGQSLGVGVMGGCEGSVEFELRFDRHQNEVEALLVYRGKVLDEETRRVEVVYPELEVHLELEEEQLVRGENGLPTVKATISYTVTNRGKGPARGVKIERPGSGTAGNAEGELPYLGPGERYVGEFCAVARQVWETIGGTSYLRGFNVDVGLKASCRGSEAEKNLSRFFDRSILDYQDLITPEDPVVKETLKKLLREKKWYDLREVEVYLLDWVGGEGVKYDYEKANNISHWYAEHGFWSQLPRETIQSRKGVCIDKAILYVTLLRAYGYRPEDVY
ncbi:MAG: transglutaminase-like domain-containing protein, partial [Candidatus Hadarchaeales archaeon]